MEAAAGLANALHTITQNHHLPSYDEIDRMLAAFSTKHRKRLDNIHLKSRWITRLEARQGWLTTISCRMWHRIVVIFSRSE